MSIKMSVLVWERSSLSGTELTALLAIADQANDETGEAYPSLDTLQAKLRFKTRKGLLLCLERVIASGELTKIRKKNEKTKADTNNSYRVEATALMAKPQLYYYTWAERQEAKQRARAEAALATQQAQTPAPPASGGCITVHRVTDGMNQGGVYPSTPKSLYKSFIQSVSKTEVEDLPAKAEATGQPEQELEGSTSLENEEQSTANDQAPAASPSLGDQDYPDFDYEIDSDETGYREVPRQLTYQSVMLRAFKTQTFLDVLLSEYPDRKDWEKLEPEFIEAALKAAREQDATKYLTPLIKALDYECAERRKAQRSQTQPVSSKTKRLEQLKQGVAV